MKAGRRIVPVVLVHAFLGAVVLGAVAVWGPGTDPKNTIHITVPDPDRRAPSAELLTLVRPPGEPGGRRGEPGGGQQQHDGQGAEVLAETERPADPVADEPQRQRFRPVPREEQRHEVAVDAEQCGARPQQRDGDRVVWPGRLGRRRDLGGWLGHRRALWQRRQSGLHVGGLPGHSGGHSASCRCASAPYSRSTSPVSVP